MEQTDKNLPKVEIYTDGACSGNPGKGGYGVILRYGIAQGKYIEKELSQGFLTTTNNRMELLAAITALEALKKPCKVTLYSDSKYLINAIEQNWIKRWSKNGWRSSDKKPVKNVDLWKRLINIITRHSINWVWVKGHNGHEFNER